MADEWVCDGYRLGQRFESGVNTNIAPHPRSGSVLRSLAQKTGKERQSKLWSHAECEFALFGVFVD